MPSKPNPPASLNHVWDILSDDILATPAEELLAEMIEDGENVDALAEEFQQIMRRAVQATNTQELLKRPPSNRHQKGKRNKPHSHRLG